MDDRDERLAKIVREEMLPPRTDRDWHDVAWLEWCLQKAKLLLDSPEGRSYVLERVAVNQERLTDDEITLLIEAVCFRRDVMGRFLPETERDELWRLKDKLESLGQSPETET